jgi:hypothetical protein
MTDDERASWLARAIDDIIRGTEPPDGPSALGQAEAESLLQTARLRLESGRLAREAASDHADAIWERVSARLGPQKTPPKDDRGGGGADAGTDDAFRGVIGLRMHMAQEALELAEAHREEVWARVRSRIGVEDERAAYRRLAEQAPGPVQRAIHQRRRADRARLTEEAETAPKRGWWPPRISLPHLFARQSSSSPRPPRRS